jgi:hypothetical protein
VPNRPTDRTLPVFLGPVQPRPGPGKRIVAWRFALLQGGQITWLEYPDREAARTERQTLLVAKNVYAVPTRRLFAAIQILAAHVPESPL